MPADFRTIISADNKPLIKSLKEAEKSFSTFKKGCENSGSSFKVFEASISTAVSSAGKFAGGLGIAFGAFDTFNKAMSSSKATQDGFNAVMGTADEVTTQFFRSLTSGDWSVFDDGIAHAITSAREYTETMRDMQRMFEVMQSRYDKIEAEKTRLESIIEDESLSLEERAQAYQQMDTLMTESIDRFTTKLNTAKSELNSAISDKIGNNDLFNAENLEELANVILDLRDPTSNLVKDLEEYKKAKEDATVKIHWNVFKESGDEAYRKTQEASRKFYSTYSKEERTKNDQLLRLQNSFNETMYQSWKGLIDEISQYAERMATWQKDLSGARDEITGATESADKSADKSSSKGKKKLEEAAEGSLAYLEKQLAAWRKKLNDATSYEARQAAKKMIDELEQNKIHIKVELEYEEAGKPKEIEPKGDSSLPFAVKARNPTADIKSGYIKVEGVDQETIQSNYDYADALNAIYDAMYSVSRITNEGATAWINYTTKLIGSISSAIPTLKKFYEANKANAIAQGAASAASTPVIGWITAIGAVTSMIAAFAAIPKFANGGIIPGNMFSGDRVPVMTNSGEMILNRSQQNNLFRMIQSGMIGGNAEKQVVEFDIKYDKLVGVLRNGERKLGRMK